ncbi:MAG: hypothetical protein ACI8T1_000782, partial [Verrucomicrobiales bacterium]
SARSPQDISRERTGNWPVIRTSIQTMVETDVLI